MTRTVSEVARLTGVTVRTLHHYDQIGLLCPSGRSDAGYRLYDDDDLRRLHAILVVRELGMPLDAIAEHLDAPPDARLAHLTTHRERLARRSAQLHAALAAVDRELAQLETAMSRKPTPPLSDATVTSRFADFDHEAHAAEAEQRWGHTEAWRESARRTAGYGPEEFAAIKAELATINEGLAALMRDGAPPTSEAAMDLAEQHRQHITRWFYDCPRPMHSAIAASYTDDPRFAANYDAVAPGLAAYVRAAVEANGAR